MHSKPSVRWHLICRCAQMDSETDAEFGCFACAVQCSIRKRFRVMPIATLTARTQLLSTVSNQPLHHATPHSSLP